MLVEDVPGAKFSPDRKYRYLLIRQLGFGDGAVMFLMLNPSTADETRNDPTIRRCINFGKAWGYGWLYVCNLSSFRATDPKEMLAAEPEPDAVWEENLRTILSVAHRCDRVIAAYGAYADALPVVYDEKTGARLNREGFVIEALKANGHDVQCLGMTRHGHPKHPLYLKADTTPVPFPTPDPHGGTAL